MAHIMSLKEAVNYSLEHLTQTNVAKLLGVTVNQVYKYSTGDTKSCRDNVVDAIFDNLDVDGEPILLDYFKDEEQYLKFRSIREQ